MSKVAKVAKAKDLWKKWRRKAKEFRNRDKEGHREHSHRKNLRETKKDKPKSKGSKLGT